MSGDIWVPTSETKALVRDGEVTAWDEMRFTRRPVGRPGPGFAGSRVPKDELEPPRGLEPPAKEEPE